MPKFETNQIDVKGDGKVILYQRPDVKKPKWYARISVQGATGYKIFSTKETDQRAAERIALDRYEELYFKVKRGGTLKGKPFRAVCEEWKNSSFVLAYEGTPSHLQSQILKVDDEPLSGAGGTGWDGLAGPFLPRHPRARQEDLSGRWNEIAVSAAAPWPS